MSERLPENTRYSHQLARQRGAEAVAALPADDPPWEPRAPTVAERAARASIVKPAPPADRGPRGPIGPSGTGPSIEEMREDVARVAAAQRRLKRKCGPGLFGDDGPAAIGAYEKVIVGGGGEGLAPIALESRVFGPVTPERVPAAGRDVYGSPVDLDPEMARLEKQVEGMIDRQIQDARREKARRLIAAIAADVMAPERRKLERLETAVRRAIELIQPSGGSFVGTDPMRALAVLRECLIPEPMEEIACSQPQS